MPPMTNSAPEATVWFRVTGRLNFPVRASDQDLLVVIRPPHPQNLWVLDPLNRWILRQGYFPEGKLWTVLADLADARQLEMIHAPNAMLLTHLVQTRQLDAGAAVRVLGRTRPA